MKQRVELETIEPISGSGFYECTKCEHIQEKVYDFVGCEECNCSVMSIRYKEIIY